MKYVLPSAFAYAHFISDEQFQYFKMQQHKTVMHF